MAQTDTNDIVDLLKLSDSYKRFKDQLIEAGIDENSAMYILGQLSRQIRDEIIREAMEYTKDDNLQWDKLPQDEAIEKLNEIFKKERGLDLAGYADFLAEQKVREFEALED